MRTLFFVILFLFMGIVSYAQDNRPNNKVPTTEKGSALANIILPVQQQHGTIFYYEFKDAKSSRTATIYKNKSTKIKRALSFMTKRERPKLA